MRKLVSNEVEVSTGVSQGSDLGPLLFLLQINDLSATIKAKSYLYTDYTTILNIHANFDELLKDLTKTTLMEASYNLRVFEFEWY